MPAATRLWHGSSLCTVQPSRVIGASSWRAEKMRLDCRGSMGAGNYDNAYMAHRLGALRCVTQRITPFSPLVASLPVQHLWMRCLADATRPVTEDSQARPALCC